MGIVRNGNTLQLQTCQTQPENSCRPSVDYLFRSAAEIFGPRTLGVILTGMGQDGLRGAGLIHRAGGTLFAQDQATSVVWGMPKAVVHANYAHKVLPLHEIASAIVQRCMKKQPVISHAAT